MKVQLVTLNSAEINETFFDSFDVAKDFLRHSKELFDGIIDAQLILSDEDGATLLIENLNLW